jgi:adenylate kinase family enzyme
MRVHIVGLPSSGKTTLAKGLSTRLNVPHHDLDAVAFLDDAWSPRPDRERDRLVDALAMLATVKLHPLSATKPE